MFDFFDELFGEADKKNFRYQVAGGKKFVLEGYKTILKADENLIVIRLCDAVLSVCGCNLKINELSKNTIKICGIIKSIIQEGASNEK